MKKAEPKKMETLCRVGSRFPLSLKLSMEKIAIAENRSLSAQIIEAAQEHIARQRAAEVK